ncbi:transposable element Tc3 transposase [Trichonephila clavipes]|nr:transposable element Tc3 transposase [Trichonephila clavipes]
MGLQFLFMDDNAPCHRTVAAEQLLESEDIERMDWPARSPDLNPIEHVCDFLGRRLAARTLPPVTIRELRLALQDEWAAMPQQLIELNTLILSMGRRCETCLAVNPDRSLECILDISRIFGKCIKAEYVASWVCSQSSVVSSSLVRINLIVCLTERCTSFELRDNISKLKRPPVGVVWKLGEDVPAQVSSSSLKIRTIASSSRVAE